MDRPLGGAAATSVSAPSALASMADCEVPRTASPSYGTVRSVERDMDERKQVSEVGETLWNVLLSDSTKCDALEHPALLPADIQPR